MENQKAVVSNSGGVLPNCYCFCGTLFSTKCSQIVVTAVLYHSSEPEYEQTAIFRDPQLTTLPERNIRISI